VTQHILEDLNLQQHGCVNLKSLTVNCVRKVAQKLMSSATYRRTEDYFQRLKY